MSFFPRDVAAPTPEAVAGPVVDWEESNCLLCGGGNWSPLVEAPDGVPGGGGLWFVVVQCQECGLCFTNPRPSAASIGQFHTSAHPSHLLPGEKRSPWWKSLWRRLARPYRERRLIPVFGSARLLDFGCGNGSFLARMHRQGWKVTGLDISLPAVKSVRAQLGLPVLQGTLPHKELRPESFDLVTMCQSLPCVHDPLRILREAHRLLVPGGKLLVVAPNIDSLPFRWFGHVWYGLDLPRHLTHFAPWTLYLMLHKAGFRIGPIRMVGHSGWLRKSAGQACQTPQATRSHHWLMGKPFSRLATWYSSLTYQADCMTVMAERGA